MRIVIVGAGRTGTQLVQHLVREKHEVSLIEPNEERARHASNRLDCMVIHDAGNNLSVLKEAGIDKAEALVCVTDSDEMNMIICGLAASSYPQLLKIARVRNDDYIRLNQHGSGSTVLGIDYFIHPDVEAAGAIIRALSHGALGNILEFAGTSFELGSISVAEGSVFDGLSMKDYRSLVKEDSLVALLERETSSCRECMFPSGATVLRKGDRIHILGREKRMEYIFRLAGLHEKPLHRIGILGGGHIACLVAERIFQHSHTAPNQKTDVQKTGMGINKKGGLFSVIRSFLPKGNRRVVMIEHNYQVCKELASRFPEALILNEDISDENFVAEERLENLDLVVATTANQELNIISAIYLKSRGVKRAIAIVSSSSYEVIARQLGIDVVIPMESVVVDSILSSLTHRGIREIHRLGDGDLEILETEIGLDSPALEKPITDFRPSEGGLVMLVNRGETSFIPRGDYVFNAGDRIILMVKHSSEAEMERFFGATGKA